MSPAPGINPFVIAFQPDKDFGIQ
jgi:hypothetical protein